MDLLRKYFQGDARTLSLTKELTELKQAFDKKGLIYKSGLSFSDGEGWQCQYEIGIVGNKRLPKKDVVRSVILIEKDISKLEDRVHKLNQAGIFNIWFWVPDSAVSADDFAEQINSNMTMIAINEQADAMMKEVNLVSDLMKKYNWLFPSCSIGSDWLSIKKDWDKLKSTTGM